MRDTLADDLRAIDLALAGPDTRETVADLAETLAEIEALEAAQRDREAIDFLRKSAMFQAACAVAAYERETGAVIPAPDPQANARLRAFVRRHRREGRHVIKLMRQRHRLPGTMGARARGAGRPRARRQRTHVARATSSADPGDSDPDADPPWLPGHGDTERINVALDRLRGWL